MTQFIELKLPLLHHFSVIYHDKVDDDTKLKMFLGQDDCEFDTLMKRGKELALLQ